MFVIIEEPREEKRKKDAKTFLIALLDDIPLFFTKKGAPFNGEEHVRMCESFFFLIQQQNE